MSIIPLIIRQRIAFQANYRCGYCLMQERISGVPLTIEHIQPRAKGGNNNEDNLWLACRLCNESKGIVTDAPDPETGKIVPLFNPRTQVWKEHFMWSNNGTQIIGRTAIGRATVNALALNTPFREHTRALWVEVGRHPPI